MNRDRLLLGLLALDIILSAAWALGYVERFTFWRHTRDLPGGPETPGP